MEPKREVKPDPRRELPAVDRFLGDLRKACPELPDWALAVATREVLDEERARLGPEASPPDPSSATELLARAAARAAGLSAPRPQRVVNATGIVLHTNLGRAPLAPAAADAAAAAAASYSDLELDLESGRRGDRSGAVARKLTQLSGAEAAFAVNNNAAAVLLVLNTLALDREVVVSRGELVEIGGSFRVPEIMERAGVRLVEVGSTNRTHRADYADAVNAQTALLLKVHRSNFEVRGFVAEVGLAELVEIASARGLPVLEDLGSGTLVELPGLPAEAYVPGRLRQGADLVCFSGDKLLGGPQAGIVLGRADLVARLRRNPLARALRLDKLGLAALDRTLDAYLEGSAEQEIPVLRQLRESPARLEARARRLADLLAKRVGASARVSVARDRTFVGGGSLPGFELESWVVEIHTRRSAARTAERMRRAPVPVLARVRDDLVTIDVRTLLEGDEAAVEAAVASAFEDGTRRGFEDGTR